MSRTNNTFRIFLYYPSCYPSYFYTYPPTVLLSPRLHVEINDRYMVYERKGEAGSGAVYYNIERFSDLLSLNIIKTSKRIEELYYGNMVRVGPIIIPEELEEIYGKDSLEYEVLTSYWISVGHLKKGNE